MLLLRSKEQSATVWEGEGEKDDIENTMHNHEADLRHGEHNYTVVHKRYVKVGKARFS